MKTQRAALKDDENPNKRPTVSKSLLPEQCMVPEEEKRRAEAKLTNSVADAFGQQSFLLMKVQESRTPKRKRCYLGNVAFVCGRT